MKAVHISANAGGIHVRPLPLPAVYRKGDAPAEYFRRQASGEIPKAEQNLSPAAFVRTIIVRDGRFTGLASAPGALLTFVVSGELSLPSGAAQATQLVSGDVFLVDADIAPRIVLNARDSCRLIQVGVAPDWPGPEAKLQVPGTATPRKAAKPNIKRLYQGEDDRTYFSEFPELFAAPPNEWSAPCAATGFRFMCWEDGFIDWHPEVVNNLAIFLSGELELESGGGSGAVEVFHAGDVCLAQDRTGEGHIDRTRGVTHVALIVVETEHLW
jgi:quercetin dioxygenase-like cupin family protein